jgi:deazaflavin-dependent oxidoreductase (nitroreductase family)
MDAQVEERLRQGFKYFNRFMLCMWRLGLGPWVNYWPDVTGRIMVITHTGRKTGLQRQTPENYAIMEGDLYCTAALGQVADWYRNIKANPKVEVWLPDGWWAGTADEISASPERLAILRQVLINSGIVGPMFGLHPKTMSDEELDAVTKDYILICIQRAEARTGSGGPGDLAWVWPAATFILLPLTLFLLRPQRRKDRKCC